MRGDQPRLGCARSGQRRGGRDGDVLSRMHPEQVEQAGSSSGQSLIGPGEYGSRPGGPIQATWDGHPLYTATADTAPGQARGNNLDAYGGIWHEVVVCGPPPSPTTPAPASGANGGYG